MPVEFGFVRVAAASPPLRVGNPAFNAQQTIRTLCDAYQRGVQLILFPELGLAGYTCGELFLQDLLLREARAALETVCRATEETPGMIVLVGLPLAVSDRLFNVHAVLQNGRILGLVPKTYRPEQGEFMEAHWMTSARDYAGPPEIVIPSGPKGSPTPRLRKGGQGEYENDPALLDKAPVPLGRERSGTAGQASSGTQGTGGQATRATQPENLLPPLRRKDQGGYENDPGLHNAVGTPADAALLDKPAVAPAADNAPLPPDSCPLSPDLVFHVPNVPNFDFGIAICEDDWAPLARSTWLSLGGAKILCNPSASNELVAKSRYRRDVVVVGHAGSCLAAYVYASAGPWESTTSLVFGGHCLIAENGVLLGETPRFETGPVLLIRDVDVDRLALERRRANSFREATAELAGRSFRHITTDPSHRDPSRKGATAGLPRAAVQTARGTTAGLPSSAGQSAIAVPRSVERTLARTVNPTPFVPSDPRERDQVCEEIFNIQTTALWRRLEHIGRFGTVLGLSGGLDSTHAALVIRRTFDRAGVSPEHMHLITMPGFGTSRRTLENAQALGQALTGRPIEVIDIRPACLRHFQDIGHPAAVLAERPLETLPAEERQRVSDLVFENVQARERKQILMDRAGMLGAIDVGTSDLTELALGWCTYNGDHMANYHVNAGVPKTLIRYLVQYVAETQFQGETARVLHDILATPVSPELLPLAAGDIAQKTEEELGPFVVHDFFIYAFCRAGYPPRKTLFLAAKAFEGTYREEQLRGWLRIFLTRFFANQFKTNCLPDGPKVGTVSFDPRSDWRMPSDADVQAWLHDLDGNGPLK